MSLKDLENEVSNEDVQRCQDELKKPDRVGTAGKAVATILGAAVGAAASYGTTRQETFMGSKILGQVVHGKTKPSLIKTFISVLVGGGIGKTAGGAAYNGGVQDEKNSNK